MTKIRSNGPSAGKPSGRKPGTPKLSPQPAPEAADRRSFSADRRGEDSAGATGKSRQRAVTADRGASSR